MSPSRKNGPLLMRVMARFGEIKFEEKYIPRSNGREVLGLCFPGESRIIINPVPQLSDTLLHEVLHDLFPHYPERAIQSLTGKLYRQLSEDERCTLYREYSKRVDVDPALVE